MPKETDKVTRLEARIVELENALKLHQRLGEDAELRTEVAQLRERMQQLQNELNRENVEDRKRRALRFFNHLLTNAATGNRELFLAVKDAHTQPSCPRDRI